MLEVAVSDPVIDERTSSVSGSPDVVPCNEKVTNTMSETSEKNFMPILVVGEVQSHDVVEMHDKKILLCSSLDLQNNENIVGVDGVSKEIQGESISVDNFIINENAVANETTMTVENENSTVCANLKIIEMCNNYVEMQDDLSETFNLVCGGASTKVHEMDLPDVVPAFAINSTPVAVLDENLISEEQSACNNTECSNEYSAKGNKTGPETTCKMVLFSLESNSSPLRSVLKKGNSISKKNLRVTFSDSEIIFVEKVPNPETSSVDNWNSEAMGADWDQWEAFSNALKLSLTSFNTDDLSYPSTSLETEDSTMKETTIQIISSATKENEEQNNNISFTQDHEPCLKSIINYGDNTVARDLLLTEDTYQSLTEANVRKHESLLINQHDNRESDSESTSSQDTIIMMTTEESIRNQELIEQSQRRYKQLIQGSSSSSSHESDEASCQNNLVLRSNSSVRRCLERTALRRSLTRCAEIRRRTHEDLVAKRKKENSSLIEKLKVLCDVSTLPQSEENIDSSAAKGCALNEGMSLSCFDLEQMQQLMMCNSPIHKLYASTSSNEISVPGDVRQWKIFSKLSDDVSTISPVSLKPSLVSSKKSEQSSIINSSVILDEKGEGISHANICLMRTETSSNSFEQFVEDPGIAELESFVEQDQDRTERLKRRYKSGEEICDEYGFHPRPSVRGIKPKFSSTTEIIKQLQKQASIPKLLQPNCSHLTWPYLEPSNASEASKKSHRNSYNFQNLYSNKIDLDTVIENEAFYTLPNKHANAEGATSSASSVLRSYNKPFNSYELTATQMDTLITGINVDQEHASKKFHSALQTCNPNVFSCPPYVPPPAPPNLMQFPEESLYVNSYKHVGGLDNRFYIPSPENSNVFPVLQNKTNSLSFMFDV